MFSPIGNRKKIILSMLFMVLLIWGVIGVSSVEAAPDLSVGTPTVFPTSVAVGRNFTLSVTVTNRGTTASPPATVIYYRSTNLTITTNDVIVGNEVVSALSPNQSDYPSISLTAPSPARTYYYGAYVTPVSGETDITNNTTSAGAALTVVGGDNLSVSVVPSSYAVVSQHGFSLVATVRNTGVATSSATTLHASQRSGSTGAIRVGTAASVPQIVGNGRVIRYISLSAPASPGTYSYRVQIGNDTTKVSSWISVTVTNPVDLSVGTPTVDKSTVAPGETFTLTTTVSNVGTGNFTGNTTLRYFRSTDTTLNATDGTDTQVGTDLTGYISGASGATSANVTLTATAPSEQGTYYYYAYVVPLPDEQYYYDRTANNTSPSYATVTVSAPPDLTVTLYRPRQSTFAPGERFTLDATVYNGGTGASAATQLRVYEDSDDYRREQQIDRQSVSAISAGSSRDESIQLAAPT